MDVLTTYVVPMSIVFLSMFVLISGVVFFGARASLTKCTSDPTKTPSPKEDRCKTGEAGLCPFEDNTGALKMVSKNKINRFDSKL